MILLWGLPEDSPLAAVHQALIADGRQVFLFNQRHTPEAEMHLCVERTVSGTLRVHNAKINLEQITAAYVRPHDSSRWLNSAESQMVTRSSLMDDAMLGWCEVTDALLVNRPSAMASNQSKPYQSALIHANGFAVPETLVTTDTAALEEFWSRHKKIIYKSISGVRSIVSHLKPEHRERFCNLASCPTQFQEWVPGRDFRVHVVGDEIFACEVCSSATDYRYPQTHDESPDISAIALPHQTADSCRRLVKALSLPLAGIDLRCTPDNEWYCFEVNPSPGFTYYQQATGQPIAQAIARLLASPSVDRAYGAEDATVQLSGGVALVAPSEIRF